eukprot:SAG31_NODE_7016_length_1816_cov_1.650553_2_plen_330_part_00
MQSGGVVGSICTAIGGGRAQREAAYDALAALARGENADEAATFASASISIGAPTPLLGELGDEAKLTQAFGQFGTVLATTMGQENAEAWITFGEAADAKKAVDGAAGLGVSELVVRALDTQQVGRNRNTSESLREHRKRVSVGVAIQCIGPLVETVFVASVSVVDAAEYHRAAEVLAELMMLDLVPMLVEYNRGDRFKCVWTSTGNAYNAVFMKDPSELSRDDALTVACDCVFANLAHATSFDAWLDPAGMNFSEWLDGYHAYHKLSPGNASDAVLERLTALLLEFVCDADDAPKLTQSGAWMALAWSFSGRTGLAMPLIEAGLLEVAV